MGTIENKTAFASGKTDQPSGMSHQMLFENACRIFDEAWDGVTPLRQLGVQVTRLSDEAYQCGKYRAYAG